MSWQKPIPKGTPTKASEETVRKPLTPVAVTVNLLEQQPTMMERLVITSLYLPVLYEPVLKTGTKGTVALTLAINLLYGGDLVFSESQENAAAAAEAEKFPFLAAILGQSLNQPIEVRRGRQLLLEVTGRVTAETEASNLFVSQFAARGGSGPGGSFNYYSEQLTGVRTL